MPLLSGGTPVTEDARKTADRREKAGHRDRLRQRLLDGAGPGMPDYEILELLLFGANARQDMKPLAKRLINKFKNLSGVLSASPEELARVEQCGTAAIAVLKAAQQAGLRLLQQEMLAADTLSSEQAVIDYCRAKMGLEPVEQFRVIFLNVQNQVIHDEEQQRGVVNHTPVYTRQVVKRALEKEASAVIMVHNHPSGNPAPSQADIQMTRTVRDALKAVDIVLHDHLIIVRGGHLSFRAQKLI